VSTNPIHITGTPENAMVQAVDVRLYFPVEDRKEDILDIINEGLQTLPFASLVSAYELQSDGFGSLVPGDAPLA
jgi:hypothetical protein